MQLGTQGGVHKNALFEGVCYKGRIKNCAPRYMIMISKNIL